jgi:RNA polymerase sigma factor (sigma-70 family)
MDGIVFARPMTETDAAAEAATEAGLSSFDAHVAEALALGHRDRALTLLMEAYGPSIHRFCTRMLGSPDTADDLLQTIFLEAYRALDRFSGSNFRGWIYGIARHRCVDQLRRSRRWRRILQTTQQVPDCATVPPATPVEDREFANALEECLRRLNPEGQAVLVLRYIEGLSFGEAAAVVGVNEGALRVRTTRALARLRGCLKKKGFAG